MARRHLVVYTSLLMSFFPIYFQGKGSIELRQNDEMELGVDLCVFTCKDYTKGTLKFVFYTSSSLWEQV